MSSYFDKQVAGFRKSASSAAKNTGPKQLKLAAPVPESAPSPAPSNASNSSISEKKRKREATNVVFSQPATTGYGSDSFTQVTYVIDHLKKNGEAKTLKAIIGYLSKQNAPEKEQALIANILKKHERVTYIPDPNLKVQTWDSGTYIHRPIINVRTQKELIAYLQTRPDAQGVSVKDLKDGWPDCEDAIDAMEKDHKILVTRTKKDNHGRMVWGNDPSLHHDIDPEFQVMWHKTELPSVDDLVRKLMEVGQKPASEDPSKRIKVAAKPKEKKKRAPRKGGKTTNTHMAHLLRDFSKR